MPRYRFTSTEWAHIPNLLLSFQNAWMNGGDEGKAWAVACMAAGYPNIPVGLVVDFFNNVTVPVPEDDETWIIEWGEDPPAPKLDSQELYRQLREDTRDASDVAALLRLAAERIRDVGAGVADSGAWDGAEEDAEDKAREWEDTADSLEDDYRMDLP